MSGWARLLGAESRTGRLVGDVDVSTAVADLELPSPVLTASGTAGHGAELAPYVHLDELGAVVVKSLAAEPWPGNPAPRVTETPAGMLNSVGLQGPGVRRWLERDLPELAGCGARVVASIWGSLVEDYERAAGLLADAPDTVVAVEVNLSCPNHHARDAVFAHSATATAEVVAATASCGRPRWAKLSPNVTDLVAIADAARQAGASAVTLVNTLMGMVIDVEARQPALGGRGGGLSGQAIGPIALRSVYDVHAALPDLPIIGVGGVASGHDAVAMLQAGASAVQVGTATFADPCAVGRVNRELESWCRSHGVAAVRDLIGAAHG